MSSEERNNNENVLEESNSGQQQQPPPLPPPATGSPPSSEDGSQSSSSSSSSSSASDSSSSSSGEANNNNNEVDDEKNSDVVEEDLSRNDICTSSGESKVRNSPAPIVLGETDSTLSTTDGADRNTEKKAFRNRPHSHKRGGKKARSVMLTMPIPGPDGQLRPDDIVSPIIVGTTTTTTTTTAAYTGSHLTVPTASLSTTLSPGTGNKNDPDAEAIKVVRRTRFQSDAGLNTDKASSSSSSSSRNSHRHTHIHRHHHRHHHNNLNRSPSRHNDDGDSNDQHRDSTSNSSTSSSRRHSKERSSCHRSAAIDEGDGAMVVLTAEEERDGEAVDDVEGAEEKEQKKKTSPSSSSTTDEKRKSKRRQLEDSEETVVVPTATASSSSLDKERRGSSSSSSSSSRHTPASPSALGSPIEECPDSSAASAASGSGGSSSNNSGGGGRQGKQLFTRFFTIQRHRKKKDSSSPGQQKQQQQQQQQQQSTGSTPTVRCLRAPKNDEWSLEDDDEQQEHEHEEERVGAAAVAMFDAPDSPENIRFMSRAELAALPGGAWAAASAAVAAGDGDGDGALRVVAGGTLAKLFQYVTSEKYADKEYVEAFIYSHYAFVSDLELLDVIEARHVVHMPEDAEWKTFKRSTLLPIRLRCYNFLKTWILLCPDDFRSNSALREKTLAFIAQVAKQSISAKTLSLALEAATAATPSSSSSPEPLPAPIFYAKDVDNTNNTGAGTATTSAITATATTSNGNDNEYVLPATFLETPPEEVARQIAAVEWELWQRIRLPEFVNKAWSGPDKDTVAANVIAMIRESNQRMNWVCCELLAHSDLKTRGLALNRLVAVAEHSLRLQNYNAVLEIYAALQMSAVFRLKQTWALLTPHSLETMDTLKHLWGGEGNWANLREKLATVAPPCIPYLGLFLTDMTFIADGNPSTIPGTDLINFGKWRTVAAVLKTVARFQKVPITFAHVPEIRAFLAVPPALDEDQQWDRSSALEDSKKK